MKCHNESQCLSFHKTLATFKNPTKIKLERTCYLNMLARIKHYMERSSTKKHLGICPIHRLPNFFYFIKPSVLIKLILEL